MPTQPTLCVALFLAFHFGVPSHPSGFLALSVAKGIHVIIFIVNYQSQTPRKQVGQAGADTQHAGLQCAQPASCALSQVIGNLRTVFTLWF